MGEFYVSDVLPHMRMLAHSLAWPDPSFVQARYCFHYKRPARKRVWKSSQCSLGFHTLDVLIFRRRFCPCVLKSRHVKVRKLDSLGDETLQLRK